MTKDQLKVGTFVYCIVNDMVIAKEIIAFGDGIATKWGFEIREIDTTWDWTNSLFISFDEANLKLNNELAQWESETLGNKKAVIELLFELSFHAGLSERKQKILKMSIDKHFSNGQ